LSIVIYVATSGIISCDGLIHVYTCHMTVDGLNKEGKHLYKTAVGLGNTESSPGGFYI